MADKRPNIVFIMSDDHASHAMSCYGSRINTTPNLDRIAEGGMRFDNCFCTNSICTPSRAAILTGTYNHVNGVTTLASQLDGRQSDHRPGHRPAPLAVTAAGREPASVPAADIGAQPK